MQRSGSGMSSEVFAHKAAAWEFKPVRYLGDRQFGMPEHHLDISNDRFIDKALYCLSA